MSGAKQDLTQGGILQALLRLALPIMGTSVMQMAYNLTDMFWLGRISSDAVAASGTAGLFIWLSVGLMLIGKVGAEIGVSQSRGRGDLSSAYRYAQSALRIAAGLGLAYGAFLWICRARLIGFFHFQEAHVAAETVRYLGIVALGIPATYINAAISGTFNASGNARTPFYINSIGLLLNMALDPVFILGLGMGAVGAAATSVLVQYMAAALMLTALKRFKNRPFEVYRIFEKPNTRLTLAGWADALKFGPAGNIFKWTLPICLESALFCLLTMITSRFEISFGAHAIAMSRVGSQVESLSWLVGAGFGSALTTFVGQNFGAGKMERIRKGVRLSLCFMAGWGLLVTLLLWWGGGLIFTVFLPDPALTAMGIIYLRILACCQIPMNMEAAAAGAFKGKGQTFPPSVTSIASNVIRVPLAYVLSKTALGLLGIWTAVSFTAALRGVVICVWYAASTRKRPNDAPCPKTPKA